MAATGTQSRMSDPQLNRPIRVLHVYRTYFPDTQGGGEELIRQICLSTGQQGVENRVFTLSRNGWNYRKRPYTGRPVMGRSPPVACH